MLQQPSFDSSFHPREKTWENWILVLFVHLPTQFWLDFVLIPCKHSWLIWLDGSELVIHCMPWIYGVVHTIKDILLNVQNQWLFVVRSLNFTRRVFPNLYVPQELPEVEGSPISRWGGWWTRQARGSELFANFLPSSGFGDKPPLSSGTFSGTICKVAECPRLRAHCSTQRLFLF